MMRVSIKPSPACTETSSGASQIRARFTLLQLSSDRFLCVSVRAGLWLLLVAGAVIDSDRLPRETQAGHLQSVDMQVRPTMSGLHGGLCRCFRCRTMLQVCTLRSRQQGAKSIPRSLKFETLAPCMGEYCLPCLQVALGALRDTLYVS